MDKLPIIYVRGYAGTTAGINGQVDDPFYGFNHGATHVRVGGDGDPMYYQFEGPLLRLMTDEGYKLSVHGDQLQYLNTADDQSIDPASLWVYRFYDAAATTFRAQPHENVLERLWHKAKQEVTTTGFDVTTAADGLLQLVQLVISKSQWQEGQPRKVYLVAHSMGGLICRSMMQRTCVDNGVPAKDVVAKLFTYGTPHRGITFAIPGGTWFEQVFGPAGSDIFAPEKMYGYLTPGKSFGDLPPSDKDHPWDPGRIPDGVFDTDDIFCIVGTDPSDYSALPRTAVGPRSDGLVQIDHAYVVNAPRAYIHKSHSGSYGEVNSEEGYQNLRRFLFGQWAVTAQFEDLTPHSTELGSWQADVRLAIRGNSVVMSEQTASHWCPVLLNLEAQKPKQDDGSNAPVPLVSTYLLAPSETITGQVLHGGKARYALSLKVYKVTEAGGSFDFTDHLEGVGAWQDTLIVDVGPDAAGTGLAAWAAWTTDLLTAVAAQGADQQLEQLPDDLSTFVGAKSLELSGGSGRAVLDLPAQARVLPILGPKGKLAMTVSSR